MTQETNDSPLPQLNKVLTDPSEETGHYYDRKGLIPQLDNTPAGAATRQTIESDPPRVEIVPIIDRLVQGGAIPIVDDSQELPNEPLLIEAAQYIVRHSGHYYPLVRHQDVDFIMRVQGFLEDVERRNANIRSGNETKRVIEAVWEQGVKENHIVVESLTQRAMNHQPINTEEQALLEKIARGKTFASQEDVARAEQLLKPIHEAQAAIAQNQLDGIRDKIDQGIVPGAEEIQWLADLEINKVFASPELIEQARKLRRSSTELKDKSDIPVSLPPELQNNPEAQRILGLFEGVRGRGFFRRVERTIALAGENRRFMMLVEPGSFLEQIAEMMDRVGSGDSYQDSPGKVEGVSDFSNRMIEIVTEVMNPYNVNNFPMGTLEVTPEEVSFSVVDDASKKITLQRKK